MDAPKVALFVKDERSGVKSGKLQLFDQIMREFSLPAKQMQSMRVYCCSQKERHNFRDVARGKGIESLLFI